MKDEIQTVKERRMRALSDENWEESMRQTIELNFKVELLDQIQNAPDDAEKRLGIINRYDAMRDIFERAAKSDFQYEKYECKGDAERACTPLKKTIAAHKQRLTQPEYASPINRLSLLLEIAYLNDQYVNFATMPPLPLTQKAPKTDERPYRELWNILQNIARFDRDAAPILTDCAFDAASECAEVEETLVILRSRRDAALAKGDNNLAHDLTWKINFQSEYLELLRRGHDPASREVAQLRDRYESLTRIARSGGLPPYTPKEQAAVAKVFGEFGPLYINTTEPVEVRTPGDMPWSGYWAPKRRNDLFAGEHSPLAKFDAASRQVGLNLSSADWERERYSPHDADWAGLCDAWALAAVTTSEPKEAVSFGGVNFSVADQKALLVKKYEGAVPFIYGNRYFGTYESDGEIQDLRPEAFHRIVEAVIGEQGRAIVVDDDPGPEVWSKPMFRMRWTVQEDPENRSAFLVKAWPLLVKSRNDLSNTLTQPQDMKAPVYEYRLYVDRSNRRDGKFLVVYGEWIGPSLSEHPDMVFLPNPDPASLRPSNPEIARGIELIDRITGTGQF